MMFLLISVVMMANDGNRKNSGKSASTTSLEGRVIDKNTGEYLAGVAVKLEGSDKVVYTDFDGNFKFASVKPGEYHVSANMISYKDNSENVKISLKDENKIELQLETLSGK